MAPVAKAPAETPPAPKAPAYDVENVKTTVEVFKKNFPDLSPTTAVAAPGRVNLIGEHTDYSLGYVMPLALTKSTYIVAAKLPEANGGCKVVSTFRDGVVVEFKIKAGLTAKDKITGEDKWANFVMGMASLYMDLGHTIAPFAAAIWSNVPAGAGLSSSAALEVSVGRMLEDMNGLTVSGEDRAKIARKCEHIFGGVECGIMDQLISSCGKLDHALFIECCDPARIVEVRIAAPNEVIVVANSMEAHSLSDSVYGQRVQECRAASAAIGVTNLTQATMGQLEAVRGKLEPTTFRRAKHVIAENARTDRAKDAFREGKLERFGELMCESHASLRDDYEVSSRGLNALVDIARSVDGVLGARMTGAGFGGCTVTLVRKDAAERLMEAFRKEYAGKMKGEEHMKSLVPDCFVTTAGDGARSLSGLL